MNLPRSDALGSTATGIVREDAKSDSIEILPFQVLHYVHMVPCALLPGKSAAGISEQRPSFATTLH